MRKRLKKQGVTPATIVTDKLGSYTTAYITGKEGPFSPYGDEFEPRRLPPRTACAHPADHLLIERDRGQFVPSRRRRMMANVRAERLLKIPAEPSPELRIPGAAAQTRVVSMAGIRLGSWESARAFKGIICVDISEVDSYMPSQAVGSLWAMSGLQNCDAISRA
jgi:hypothetical protein